MFIVGFFVIIDCLGVVKLDLFNVFVDLVLDMIVMGFIGVFFGVGVAGSVGVACFIVICFIFVVICFIVVGFVVKLLKLFNLLFVCFEFFVFVFVLKFFDAFSEFTF